MGSFFGRLSFTFELRPDLNRSFSVLELADQKDNKLTLVKLKFSMNSYENLAENETKKVGNCTRLISSDTQFRKKWKHNKLCERVDAWRSRTKSNNCDLWAFSIVFLWKSFFFPDENSKLHSYKKLTNTALEILLKELFTLNPKNNEHTINEYIKQRQINMTWPTLIALYQSTILVYLKLLTLDRFNLLWKNNKH